MDTQSTDTATNRCTNSDSSPTPCSVLFSLERLHGNLNRILAAEVSNETKGLAVEAVLFMRQRGDVDISVFWDKEEGAIELTNKTCRIEVQSFV